MILHFEHEAKEAKKEERLVRQWRRVEEAVVQTAIAGRRRRRD